MKKYKRPSWDEYFLEIAKVVGTRGTCDRGRNGAVIVKDKRILTTGYVGAPSGLPHCDEVGHLLVETIDPNGKKRKHCIRTTHAEQNAIVQAALHGVSTKEATMYVKFVPCFTCLPMGEYVYNDFTPVKVEDVKMDTTLFSLTGKSEVRQKFERWYKGDIVILKPRGFFPIKLTPEHPVLIYDGAEMRSKLHLNAVYKYQNKPIKPIDIKEKWIAAKDIKVGDYLILPKIKGKSKYVIDFKTYSRYPWSERMNEKMKKPQKIDNTFAWFLGWYVAEGHASIEREGGVMISLGKHEKKYIKKLTEICKLKLGCVKIRNKKTATCIEIDSGVLARFLRQNFGRISEDKRIPSWFFELPKNVVRSFLEGYILGDGALSRTNYGYNYIEITTTSKYLAYQLPLLFAKLGIVPLIYEVKARPSEIEGRKIIPKNKIYLILIAGKSVKKIFKDAKIAKIDKKHYLEMKDKLLVPVTKVEYKKYDGLVFNFETSDNTFCIPFVVHNCAKMIINAGIKRVVAEKDYHDSELTKKFFKEAGVKLEIKKKEVEKYPDQE